MDDMAYSRRAILLVEDDHDYAHLVRAMLELASPGEFETTHVDSLAEAQAHVLELMPDCVVLDLSLPDARHLEALADLRAVAPRIPIVVLSGREDEMLAITAVQEGGQDYLIKSRVDGDVLRRVILYAIERKRTETERLHEAMHDPVTCLPNRAVFIDRLTHAFARSTRYGTRIAVLFIDLDGFKQINDTLGHSVGDDLLWDVANRLRGAIRDSDTAARFGGDEFTILCEQISGEHDAIATAKRILGGMSQPFEVDGEPLRVSLSIGIAVGGAGSEDSPESLIRDADAAMYAAKQDGNGSYRVCPGPPPIASRAFPGP